MKKNLVFSFFVGLLLLAGCNGHNQTDISPPIFNWNSCNYVVTNEPITENQIEERIGEIKKQTTALPTKHEEGYRLKTGLNIYKIKGEEISNDKTSKMAIEIESEYRVARIIVDIK